jgi:type 1 glutamine amidotransferase
MMPERTALIISGGWEGHQPEAVAKVLAQVLEKNGVKVIHARDLSVLADPTALSGVGLIIMNWTMGSIEQPALLGLQQAIQSGTGLAGVHGGMADAFRQSPDYQYIVGGQFVAHPGGGGVTYRVHIVNPAHPLTAGIDDFSVTSEKYYLHIDPAIDVLATTDFDGVAMPVAWTKRYGKGRVFYCALGHDPRMLERPEVNQLVERGLLWALGGDG